jgi:A/G-specific adenine glycosylase
VDPLNQLSSDLRRRVRRRLLAWFDRHRRDLPWRNGRDPYRIWVSEIMLQQTQVATVIPYFQRFVARFPTVQALAAADEQDVLRLWEGLGYYRRARHLHQAARQLVGARHRTLPDDPDLLRGLPGIGRYTLGAVLSQAFDRRLAILEANSIRVLCRLFGVRETPSASGVQAQLWRVAEALLPVRRVGDFNQALMELGALVCTPAGPDCGHCPLAAVCTARRLGIEKELPAKGQAPPTVAVNEVAVVVRRGRKVLVVQRPDHGRWSNLWEFPHDALQPGETHEAAALRMLPALTGVTADLGSELLTVRHVVTRFAITLVGLEGTYRGGEFRSIHYQLGRWAAPSELTEMPFSVPQRRLARMLVATVQPRLF